MWNVKSSLISANTATATFKVNVLCEGGGGDLEVLTYRRVQDEATAEHNRGVECYLVGNNLVVSEKTW